MERYWKNKLFSLILGLDMLAVYLSFVIGFAIAHGIHNGANGMSSVQIPFFIVIIIGPYFLFVFKSTGLYKVKTGILHIRETISIVEAILVGFFFIWLLLFFVPEFHNLRLAVLISMVFTIIFIAQERLFIRKWIQRLHMRGIGMSNAVIIGMGDIAHKLAYRLQNMPKLGFNPVGFISTADDPVRGRAAARKIPVLGGLDSLQNAIDSKKIESVFVAEPILSYDKILHIMNVCDERKVDFRFVPYIYNLTIDRILFDDIEGIPIIGFRKYNPRALYTKIKRLIDIGFSSAAIIGMFPVGAFIALAIKMDSPGRIFFSQKRVGQNGRTFRILKFRTMFNKSSKYAVSPKDSADNRITRIGRFFRKTSLDELPQLINVLRGDMSLVGPRPEMPFIVKEYDETQKERLKVKPGITGLWQISEDRKVNIHENMEYDLYYIENQCFLLDLAIILRTALSVFQLRGK